LVSANKKKEVIAATSESSALNKENEQAIRIVSGNLETENK